MLREMQKALTECLAAEKMPGGRKNVFNASPIAALGEAGPAD
jgi:hypothetical protein